MRTLKFRARWRDTGKVVSDFMEEYTIDALNDDTFISEQFTGLLDKNGKEIYEGDIVVTKGDETPMVIGWKEYHASFCIDKKGWLSSHYFGEAFDGDQCEIIGNIHQNSELLK